MAAHDEKIRVLLLAEMANPAWQSVPLVGWSHCEAIARLTDAHLVTQVRNLDAILDAGYREGEEFTVIDSELIAKPMWKLASLLRGGAGKGWTTIQALAPISYYQFEWMAWRRFRHALKAGEFDLVHRVTPMSPAVPSPMAKWCHQIGVPFVLGPLNGGLPWPREYPELAKQEREWLVPLRRAHRWMPYHRSMRRLSSAVLLGSANQWDLWQDERPDASFYMPENGIDPERFPPLPRSAAQLPLRLLFVGRMVPYKGGDLVIRAAADFVRRGEVELTFIGDGPHRPTLEQLVAEAGIGSGVRFIDNVPHRDLAAHYANADLFAFPTLRELGGAVVLEAMAQGVVPIVVDYGGPPEFISPDNGVVVPMGPRETVLASLRREIARFVADPSLLEPMSRAARADVMSRFTWEAKAHQDVEVYRWLLGRGPKPPLRPPMPFSATSQRIDSADHSTRKRQRLTESPVPVGGTGRI